MEDPPSDSLNIQRLRTEIDLLNEELREKRKLLALLEDQQVSYIYLSS